MIKQVNKETETMNVEEIQEEEKTLERQMTGKGNAINDDDSHRDSGNDKSLKEGLLGNI